ncbi:MAG: hypothetical protein JW940_25455 [Polyangiaceae bacterium]|nr:hypothetical protein [Polyangiaceae bacterium]
MALRKAILVQSINCSVAALCAACGAVDPEGFLEPADHRTDVEASAVVSSALTTSAVNDDSAAPVHTQIKYCTTTSPASAQTADCMVDAGYALVGGGGFVHYSGYGAMITESRPLDDRTWRVSSHDHLQADAHNLTTYAVGLRLDGVNAQSLRNLIGQFTVGVPNYNSISSSGILRMISGGAMATGASRFLVASKPSWTAIVKDHLVAASGGVGVFTTYVELGIIEGFGALDISQRTGIKRTVATGVASSTGSIRSGWAAVGYGGEATWSSGPGRMLFAVGPNGDDARRVVAKSKDHAQASKGGVTPYWTEARKTPNSHGLCNPGGALAASMDACVSSICAADAYCCNTYWDGQCVDEVQSICGKSCANYTCDTPDFEPDYWNTADVVGSNNCYNYATNTRTDTFAQVGRASGEWCNSYEDPACMTSTTIARLAANDGLIPSTATAECPDHRSKVVLFVRPGFPGPAYHWYRQDRNGRWSNKYAGQAVSGQQVDNPELAIGSGWELGGYFCTCSSRTQGAGHAVIQ